MPKNRAFEELKKEAALDAVAGNPANHFPRIAVAALEVVAAMPAGMTFTSGEIRDEACRRAKAEPVEPRVFGPVMLSIQSRKIARQVGSSNRGREHNGLATEWQRTARKNPAPTTEERAQHKRELKAKERDRKLTAMIRGVNRTIKETARAARVNERAKRKLAKLMQGKCRAS